MAAVAGGGGAGKEPVVGTSIAEALPCLGGRTLCMKHLVHLGARQQPALHFLKDQL